MKWLLDTCVVSELVRPKPDPAVVARDAASEEALVEALKQEKARREREGVRP